MQFSPKTVTEVERKIRSRNTVAQIRARANHFHCQCQFSDANLASQLKSAKKSVTAKWQKQMTSKNIKRERTELLCLSGIIDSSITKQKVHLP